MARIVLNITPLAAPDATQVQVWESADVEGPFVLVDTLPSGDYPNYVTSVVSDLATNATDYFAVQWLDVTGAPLTPLSPPLRAQEFSFVQMVADRVKQRDKSLNDDVVVQEAEAAIERYFNKNPYAVDFYLDLPAGRRYSILNGLTYLVMARTMLDRIVKSSNVTSATMGLVTMRSGEVTSGGKNIELLIEMANELLEGSYSIVMLLEEIDVGNSVPSVSSVDQSRLVVQTEIL